MATNFEHGGLKWVIDEIYETLKQARVHFESFVEDEEDNSQLQFCTTYLHQVAGSLNMLELGGATLLAEEMEFLSQAIYDDNIARREDSFEVLMRALIQLPDYLERLERGARDLPMVLLPLLNDLRATRGEKLLTEGAVFSVNITLENITPEPDNGIEPGQLAKKIRHHYHLGLLGWYRDSESIASLNKVKKVVFKLKESVKTPTFYQLFSLMEAFIEGLMDRCIDSSASTKLLLGQADRYIKQLIDSGELTDSYSANDEQELQSLKKNLLFYIAHSSSSNSTENSAINSIKSFYNLAEIIPDEDEIEDARASMGGANADLMETVTGVILGDLSNVKEQLDVFVRNVSELAEGDDSPLAEGTEHRESLDVIIATMTQISDTLAMLGQNAPRGILQEKIEQLKSMLDSGELLERNQLMEIASALLYVESAVAEMGKGGLFNASDEDEEIDLSKIDMTDQEKNELRLNLVDETKIELSKAKDGIVSLIDTFANNVQNPEQNEHSIDQVHSSLLSIAGVLDILEKEKGAQIVKECAAFISEQMVSDNELASGDEQQYLADTITALDYYLDAIAENQKDLSIIESVAQTSVDQLLGRETDEISYESELSETLAIWMQDVSISAARDNLLKTVISVAEQVKLLQNDKAEEIAHQMKSMISLVGDNQDSLSDDISSTLRWATETINRIICNATELKGSEPAGSEKKTLEESDAINESEMPQKVQDDISEKSATSSEDNDSLDETASAEIDSLAEGSSTEIPLSLDLAEPIDLIDEVHLDKQVPSDTPETSLVEESIEAASADLTIDDPAKEYPDIKKLETSDDVDPEIMEIFIEEAQEEIEKISNLYPQWKSTQDSNGALTEMRRSFHTLKGSGRLVGAYEMGEFSWAFENMINRMIDKTIVVDDLHFAIVESAIEILPEIINAFEQQRLSNVDSSRIAAYAHILSKGELFDIRLLSHDEDEGSISVSELDEILNVEDSISADGSTQIENSISAEGSISEGDLSVEDDDEGIDPVLLEIFTNEALSHINNIEQCIEQCHLLDDVCPPDDLLIRSLHTLRGSAHMADIHAIGNVSEQMEKTVKVIAKKGQKLDLELIHMLEELCQFSSSVLDKLNGSVAIPDDNLELKNKIIEKYEQVLLLENLLDAIEVSEEIDISEERLEAEQDEIELIEVQESIDETGQVEKFDVVEKIDLADTSDEYHINEAAPADEEITVSDETPNIDAEQSPEIDDSPSEEYDDELLEIFVEEGEELLESSEQALHKLKDDNNDAQALNRLLRDMHTLKGGARMAGVTAIGDLTHSFESKLDQFTQGEMSFSSHHIELLLQVHDVLSVMVEKLKNGQKIETNSEIIEQLDSISEEEPIEPEVVENSVAVETNNEIELEELEEEKESLTDERSIQLEDEVHPVEANAASEDEAFSANNEAATETTITLDDSAEIYDDDLMEIFLEEAHELMESSDSALSQLKQEPNNSEQLNQLLRDLHTIKGGARMAGITPIGDLTHSLETQLERITDQNQTPSMEFFELLHQAHDTLNDMLDDLKTGKPVRSAEALINQAEVIKQGESSTESEAQEIEEDFAPKQPTTEEIVADEDAQDSGKEVEEQTAVEDESEQVEISKQDDHIHELGESSQLEELLENETQDSSDTFETEIVDQTEPSNNTIYGTEPQEIVPEKVGVAKTAALNKTERVRVSADILDELVNYAGEVSIYRSRLNQGSNEFQSSLDEMNTTIIRLREQLRRFEMETEAQIQSRRDQAESLGFTQYEDFDPLEFDRFSNMQQITRAMAETVVDLDSIESTMKNLNSESETLLIQQGRVNTDLQEGLMRTRMVPFKSQLTRLRRIIRQTSKELKKQVNFELHGGDQEIDRRVLEKMMAPLEHMLRNAVAHGIETPEEREKAGKKAAGNIKLIIGRDGSEIEIKVIDDGAGVNIDAVRKKAIDHGLMVKNADLSEQDIMQFILESGFTTATEVSQIAGRGVGMDVVNAEIKQLNGTLEINSNEGKGAVFKVLMPLTMSVSRALMVEVGEEIFAIPLVGIENIIRESNDVLERLTATNDTYYQWHDEKYQFMHLGTALGINSPILPGEKNKAPILLARSGEHRVALFVDGLMGSREIVVKSVGPQLSTVKGVTGATILGDGKISLILDLGVLAREGAMMKSASEQDDTIEVVQGVIPTVMVVDDSITVRKVTQRLLHRYDYQVITAKDGVDAIATLHETIPDVMLLDVEMPRMDGFELATHMRDDDKFKNIPIIMITSRTGDKHRERALKIGVNEYMGKPYQEHDLISNIRKLTEI